MDKEDRMLETVMPHNQEAEMAVLGSMILDRDAIGDVSLLLKSEDFYAEKHQKIFDELLTLYEKTSALDILILKEQLEKASLLDSVGGADYLVELAESVPSAANAEHYANIVRERSVQRRLIQAATRIIQDVRNNPEDVGDLLDNCEQRIFEIAERGQTSDTESIQSLLKAALQRIDNLQGSETGRITGISTGYPDLDEILDGMHPAELLIVAGRPSMGKTSLALNIADNAATRGDKRGVLIFSCEMAREQIAQNMLCANAHIDAHKMRRGNLDEKDWQELPMAADRLSNSPIFIDDTPGLSVLALRSKARRLCARHKIEVLIVDYMQLLTAGRRAENRQMEITYISQSLKHLARELRVPIVALSQLNRAVDARQDKRPMMADLRESGSIEQDADVILFLYRDEYYHGTTPDNQNVAEVNVAKQRNGPTGKVELRFYPQYMRFENRTFVEPRETLAPDDFRL
ncbi:MAG: replicative DNA helicase [Planctomycetota bacterium]|jgi:replicative DNA helicase